MRKNLNKIVIFYGPPGSGKGTQAKLLADNLGFFHLDSGDYLRKLIYNPGNQKNKIIEREKKLNESGKLQTPSFVLGVLSKRIKELIALRQSIAFSGSPRTFYEAFGRNADSRGLNAEQRGQKMVVQIKKTRGEIQILEKSFGRKNIFVFILNIPEEESVKRNSKRLVCSVCKTPILGTSNCDDKRGCPFCGGAIQRRIDDDPNKMKVRLNEYNNRTAPIFAELKKRKYTIFKIDGTPAPYKIHAEIVKKISNYSKQSNPLL